MIFINICPEMASEWKQINSQNRLENAKGIKCIYLLIK